MSNQLKEFFKRLMNQAQYWKVTGIISIRLATFNN